MKRTFKMVVKKDEAIKAIIDTDGKILTSDRNLKTKISTLMREDMVTQSYAKGINSTSFVKVTNEMQLYAHLKSELSLSGYDVE